ncbi:hypothetical protein FRB94_004951 [Tulasnella sp. JGI-2019a]|nr:hypothetical protein FRB94_004951 [Tulasnella sp. JGI-2019a]
MSFFYVHKALILNRSTNFFGHRFPRSQDDTRVMTTTSPIHYLDHDGHSSASSASILSLSQANSQASANPMSQAIAREQQATLGGIYDGGLPRTTFSQLASSESQREVSHVSNLPRRLSSVFLRVEETSIVLNLTLHLIYDMSFARYPPDIETIAQALTSLRKYGIAVPADPSAEIWSTLLLSARSNPIRAYSIAASHGVASVAKSASRYTLSTSLDTVSEGDALTMGPIYLRLLFFLHVGRQTALLRVIRTPPKEHLPTAACSISAQHRVVDAWSVVVAAITSGRRSHGTSSVALLEAFSPLIDKNTCELCRENAQSRISEMTEAWLAIRTTI